MPAEIPLLLRDRRLRTGALLPTLALLLIANLVIVRWRTTLHAQQDANLLRSASTLAEAVSSARFDHSVGQMPQRFWPAIPDAMKNRLVILTGMSQMYAINEVTKGDQTISEWLDDHYAPMGVRVFGLSAPNLANEEAMFLLLAELSSPRTTPAVLILGVNFDKFRNVDLRAGYRNFLRDRREVSALWNAAAAEYATKYPLATAKMHATATDSTADAAADTTSLEQRIRARVGRVVPMVSERRDLNFVFSDALYHARNKILRISTATKRPIIQSRYDMNVQFLQMMVDVAHAHGVQIVLYVCPLNPLAANPYVPAQYEAFKTWLQRYAAEQHVPFANLENEIPAPDWGLLMGQPDFMHFKGEGHRKTALAIEREFDSVIRGATGTPVAEAQPK